MCWNRSPTRVDVAVLLAVGPDTGKQSFLDDIPHKIAALQELSPQAAIVVDGAVTRDNIGDIARMGPHVIVTGSAAFAGGDPALNIRDMLEQIGG